MDPDFSFNKTILKAELLKQGYSLVHTDEQKNNTIKVYPNPVVDISTLEINTVQANAKAVVVISNTQGQVVYKSELFATQNNLKDKINMSNLITGAYTITVFFNDGDKKTLKVVKL